MSLKFAILGFLLDCPMHGYRLKQVLSPALPRRQAVNDGVLYPLLARMEKEGLIRKTTERGRNTPDRRVIHPTSKGRNAFASWLEGPDGEKDEVAYDFLVSHPFLIKCMFLRRLSPEAVARKLAEQKKSAAAKIASFERIRAGMVERKVDPFRIAILDLGMAQQREKLRWLDRLAAGIKRRPAPFGSRPPRPKGAAS